MVRNRSSRITLKSRLTSSRVSTVGSPFAGDLKSNVVWPIYDITQILEDPHFAARGMLQKSAHPRLGEGVLPGVVPKLSDTPGTVRRAAPLLGEHTEEVLAEIGYGAEEIAGLRQRAVV